MGLSSTNRKRTIACTAIITSVVVVVATILAFIAFNCAFKQEAPSEWMRANCDFGEFLGYLGSCVAAVATVALATVSYVQTKWAYEDQERREQENTKRPFFVIASVKCGDEKAEAFNANGAFECSASKAVHSIEIVLQNVGDGPANNYHWELDGFGVSPDAELELSCVPSACSKSQMVRVPQGNDVVVNVVKSLEYENILGCKYRQQFRMTCRLSVVRDMVDSHALGAERQIFVQPLGPQKVLKG